MADARKEQFASFGFVQFVASVHIFTHHLWQQTRYLARWKYRAWGVSWVACFFVLSGFKLTYSQLRRKDPRKLEPFVPYMWRRLVRLYPIYYLSLFLTLVLALVRGDPVPTWIVLPFNITLTFTWIGSVAGGWHAGWHGTHWYMSDLILHQILWRWVFPVVNRLSAPVLCVVLACCCALMAARCACIQWEYCEQEVTYWPGYTFHMFVSGMCIAKLYVLRSDSPRGAVGDPLAVTVGGRRVPLSGVFSFALVLLAFEVDPLWVSTHFKNCTWTGILLPLHLLLVWCLCLEEGPLDWLCRRRPFSWMGELSYGVYILHWNALMVTQRYGHEWFPEHWSAHFRFWCVILPATVLFSGFATVCVDRPAQAWASNFLRRATAPPQPHEKTS